MLYMIINWASCLSVFLAPNDLSLLFIFWGWGGGVLNLLTLSVHDEGYYRNESSVLNYILFDYHWDNDCLK